MQISDEYMDYDYNESLKQAKLKNMGNVYMYMWPEEQKLCSIRKKPLFIIFSPSNPLITPHD